VRHRGKGREPRRFGWRQVGDIAIAVLAGVVLVVIYEVTRPTTVLPPGEPLPSFSFPGSASPGTSLPAGLTPSLAPSAGALLPSPSSS